MDNNEQELLEKAKAAKAKKIGIIILVLIAIPALLFGACILFLNNAAG